MRSLTTTWILSFECSCVLAMAFTHSNANTQPSMCRAPNLLLFKRELRDG